MKRISITSVEASILDKALAKYGSIVTFSQLNSFIDKKENYVRKRINHLAKQGQLKRIKNGLYVITGSMIGSFGELSPLLTAQLLVPESYVSFAAALQHYGFYDQLLKTVTSISLKRRQSTDLDGVEYKFITTISKNFFGWCELTINGKVIKIASVEKALLDFLQFQRTLVSADLVLEKLIIYGKEIDQEYLIKLALQTNLTTQRILGFLLDLADLDSTKLVAQIRQSSSVSRLTFEARNFNSKWRLYYDDYFINWQRPTRGD